MKCHFHVTKKCEHFIFLESSNWLMIIFKCLCHNLPTSKVSFFGFFRPHTARRSIDTELRLERDSMQCRILRTHPIIMISKEPTWITQSPTWRKLLVIDACHCNQTNEFCQNQFYHVELHSRGCIDDERVVLFRIQERGEVGWKVY